MKKLTFTLILLGCLSSVFAADHIAREEAYERKPLFTAEDTAGGVLPAWYHPERIYIQDPVHYTLGNFFSALDLPTVFGVGFNPTGNEKGIGYYSQMFLEWRHHKTYGIFVAAGLDSHNQSYRNLQFPASWSDQAPGVWCLPGNHDPLNIASGTIYNMELMVGPGYRIPLVKDLRSYYEHPYLNKYNLSVCAQFGYAWSTLKNVKQNPEIAVPGGAYDEVDVNYFHPVMKFNTAFEFFTGPGFSVFIMASYMQHLRTMPWDNPKTHAGTLALSVGFSGFFD